MTDREALLAAVRAAPDDDLPRLVFADFLEESGHPADAARAAYIRLQVDAEGHPPGSSARLELTRRAEELRPSFRDEWETAFAPGRLDGVTVTRRRGFVDEVHVAVDRAGAIFGHACVVAPVTALHVASADRSTSWGGWGFLRDPSLGRLRVLRFGPHLPDLIATHVPRDGGGWVDGPAFDALFDTPHLRAVRRLDVSGNDLDDGWVVGLTAALPSSAFRSSLVELDLSRNLITDAGANALAAGHELERLERLNLAANRISPAGAAVLRRRFGDRVVV